MKPADLREAFKLQIPSLKAWGDFLTCIVIDLVTTKLRSEGRDPDLFFKIPPKARVKSEDSFLQKALYRNKPYTDPISEISDKVGTRFVVLLNRDVEEVSEIITSYIGWHCRLDKDIEFEKEQKPTHFDYQSKHFVVSPSAAFTTPEGILVPSGMPCEVQIRTLLQHAYAELAHDTVYKPKIAIENLTVYRKIAKSMALIETTGDIFTDVADVIKSEESQLVGVLRELVQIYSESVCMPPSKPGKMEQLFIEGIGNLATEITADAVKATLDLKPYISKRIRERRDIDPFYKSAIAPATYMLAEKKRLDLEGVWPLPARIREEVYSDLGYVTE